LDSNSFKIRRRLQLEKADLFSKAEIFVSLDKKERKKEFDKEKKKKKRERKKKGKGKKDVPSHRPNFL
jgi:hypothetical protein